MHSFTLDGRQECICVHMGETYSFGVPKRSSCTKIWVLVEIFRAHWIY